MADVPIILYHYWASPFARRVGWYLQLRKIPYTQCLQPPILPRPDLSARLGITYRRIPLLAIGRDVYLDSRLIIAKLEQLFPPSDAHPALSVPGGDQLALERLLSRFTTGELFSRAAQLIPPEAPMLQDPKFVRDRADLTGGVSMISPDSLRAARPEALTVICDAMRFLETTLLADGRDWVLKTAGPSLADLEAVWVFHWLFTMPSALPPHVLGPNGQFPNVYAFIQRFNTVVKAAGKSAGPARTVKGDEAAKMVTGSRFAADQAIESSDPIVQAEGLSQGLQVSLWPTDSGSAHKTQGKLAGMNSQEIIIEVEGDAGLVRVHAPRQGFKVRKAGGNAKAVSRL